MSAPISEAIIYNNTIHVINSQAAVRALAQRAYGEKVFIGYFVIIHDVDILHFDFKSKSILFDMIIVIENSPLGTLRVCKL